MLQQNAFGERIKAFFSKRETLPVLILINLGVWISALFIRNLAFLFSSPSETGGHLTNIDATAWISSLLALPSNLHVLLTHPWTPFTYMFLHFEFLHILFNMLWLWWFGAIFMQYLSGRQLLGTYILGGFTGALFYVAAFNFFPVFETARFSSMALGASASVLAIVVAISFYVPEYTVHLFLFGPVKIKYIAIATIAFDVMMIGSSNAGGHIAHLGGALWGFLYIRMLPGTDPTRIFGLFENINFQFPFKKRNARFRVYRNDRPLTDEEYNRNKALHQQRIDKILDKISKSGYESLSSEEKEILFSSSQKKK